MSPNKLRTTAGEFEVALAEVRELDTVLTIIDDAAQWVFDTRGIKQWGTFPFAEGFIKMVQGCIERGEVYLVKKGNEAVATLTLQWEDEYFWGKRPDDAGYVHRLAVRSAYHGQGIGQAFLEWAGRVIEEVGRPYVRLDCMTENPELNRYYVANGFVYKGELKDPDRWSVNLYEKRIL